MQIVADAAHEPFANLRILDLACLEGLYAVEMARQGARSVAIEGREANHEKVRFVKQALGLDNLTLYLDDVRNLSRETHGEFDVVLCLGILYHLDAPDVFRFVEKIGEVTTRFAVFDTYVSTASKERHTYQGKPYWGRSVEEHSPADPDDTRLSRLWNSLDNPKSLWLTRRSLFNLLSASGFTSVHECHCPADVEQPSDRVVLLAIKGTPQTLRSTPRLNDLPVGDWPETFKPRLSSDQDPRARLSKTISHMVPSFIKGPAKTALRTIGLLRHDSDPWSGTPRPPRTNGNGSQP